MYTQIPQHRPKRAGRARGRPDGQAPQEAAASGVPRGRRVAAAGAAHTGAEKGRKPRAGVR